MSTLTVILQRRKRYSDVSFVFLKALAEGLFGQAAKRLTAFGIAHAPSRKPICYTNLLRPIRITRSRLVLGTPFFH